MKLRCKLTSATLSSQCFSGIAAMHPSTFCELLDGGRTAVAERFVPLSFCTQECQVLWEIHVA